VTVDAIILSYALDTNGQNVRFVKAAEKWGTDDGILEALAIGKTDPAGVVARYQEASDKTGELRIRSAHRAQAYFEFPHDLTWDRQTEPEIRKLASEADVIHLNNSEAAYTRFRLKKPALLHHHGSLFRSNPKRMLDLASHFRWVQAVSTIDLQQPAPDVLHWLPSAYDIDELEAFGNANRREPDGRVRIVSCPTNRAYKHTDLLIAAVMELQAEGLPVDLVLVEGKPWAESLAAKAQADIVFDQLLFGYGCNSIEAWGMGVPVISGADEWTLGRMAQEWPAIPFEEANERTLKDVIRAMVTSAELREDAAERGRAHVRKYHDERPALARLAELYAKAIRTYSRIRIPGKAAQHVTFRDKKGRPVYDPTTGERIQFTDGKVTTDDTLIIERLRYLAKRPAAFGIEEVA
jgi:hypothetical protein